MNDDLTVMLRALGDPTRRAIFEFLCARATAPVAIEESGAVHPVNGATVGEVCCFVTGSESFSSTVSFHLKELRIAGLIESERKGRYLICSVRRESLGALERYFRGLADRAAGRVEVVVS